MADEKKPQSAPDTLSMDEALESPSATEGSEETQSEPQGTIPKLQKAFDDLTTVTPEQEAGHSWLTNKAQEFGAGAIGSLSPLIHPLDTLRGAAGAIAHPEETAKNVWAGVKEHPAQFAGNLVGGAVTGGLAAEAGAPLIARIPTKAKAGAVFQDVMAKAADQPVWMQRSGSELQRAIELADRGGVKPGPVSKLARRVGNVNNAPMTYKEARDFATNLSDLSADEKMALKPVMRRQMGKLAKTFNQDVGDAADRVGMRPQYDQAMKDYAQAARIQNFLENAKKLAVPAAAGAVGLGAVHKLAKAMQ